MFEELVYGNFMQTCKIGAMFLKGANFKNNLINKELESFVDTIPEKLNIHNFHPQSRQANIKFVAVP